MPDADAIQYLSADGSVTTYRPAVGTVANKPPPDRITFRRPGEASDAVWVRDAPVIDVPEPFALGDPVPADVVIVQVPVQA